MIRIITISFLLLYVSLCYSQNEFQHIENYEKVKAVKSAHDSRLFAVISESSKIKVWDTIKGELLFSFSEHVGPINDISFSANNKFLISGSGSGPDDNEKDNTTKIWDLDTGNIVVSIPNDTPIVKVDISSSGKFCVLADENNKVKIYITETGTLLRSYTLPSLMNLLSFFPNENQLLVGTSTHVKVYDLATNLETFSMSSSDTFLFIRTSENNKKMLVISTNLLIVYDLDLGIPVITKSKSFLGSFRDIAISSDGTLLYAIYYDSIIKSFFVENGDIAKIYFGHSGSIESIDVSPTINGDMIFSTDNEKNIIVWNSESGSTRSDDFGNDATNSYDTLINEWLSGVLEVNGDTDWFSFDAIQNEEYMIRIISNSEKYLDISLYDSSNGLIKSTATGEQGKIGFICTKTGKHYIKIQGAPQSLYIVSILTLTEQQKRILEYLQTERSDRALFEIQEIIKYFPDDPEINLYAAFLRIVSHIEKPDDRLFNLLSLFGIKVDLFPKAKVSLKDALESKEKFSKLQEYGVVWILPLIDDSLQNLSKVLHQSNVSIIVPSNFKNDAKERVKSNWFVVDDADAQILTAGLLMVKSGILLMNAFDVGVEGSTLKKHFEVPEQPSGFEQFLNQYPDLMSGKRDIRQIFEASMKVWLLASQNIKEGMAKIIERKDPTELHLFYADDEDIRTTIRYISLLDRVFQGLLSITGGDLNGDTQVDYWDFHDLNKLINNEE